jgi:2-keto-4-pentenoate hydratase/2-oxohepta-3-ene-1,7-dioic acid hydratase in catechol pathway
MKIFNFIDNTLLSGSAEAVFCLKPETSLSKKNVPFFIPGFSNDIRFNPTAIIKINKLGKGIKQKFAHSYFNQYSIGINFFAYDLLIDSVKKGLPWDKAVCFDSCVGIGDFLPVVSDFSSQYPVFSIKINDKTITEYSFEGFQASFNKAIEIVSEYFTLKIGDYIIIEKAGFDQSVQIGDRITTFMTGDFFLEFKIK